MAGALGASDSATPLPASNPATGSGAGGTSQLALSINNNSAAVKLPVRPQELVTTPSYPQTVINVGFHTSTQEAIEHQPLTKQPSSVSPRASSLGGVLDTVRDREPRSVVLARIVQLEEQEHERTQLQAQMEFKLSSLGQQVQVSGSEQCCVSGSEQCCVRVVASSAV